VAKSDSRLNVLFIGNSFTARNDLPGLIGRLAEARGHALAHRLISAGGASLRMHWNKGEARREIERTRYDYVVLQEQSTLPIKNAARMHESIRLFDEAIRSVGEAANSADCPKTALYLTWARRNAPADAQQAITDAYMSIGREIGAIVVPVGIAWQRVLTGVSPSAASRGSNLAAATIVLHDKDQSHPTLAGSYLAACVFFSTLFGQSPEGIDGHIPGLNTEDTRALQRAAADVAPMIPT